MDHYCEFYEWELWNNTNYIIFLPIMNIKGMMHSAKISSIDNLVVLLNNYQSIQKTFVLIPHFNLKSLRYLASRFCDEERMCPIGFYSLDWFNTICKWKKNKNPVIFNIENKLLEYDFGTFCTQLKLSEKF